MSMTYSLELDTFAQPASTRLPSTTEVHILKNIVCCTVPLLLLAAAPLAAQQATTAQRAALVTGARSGIGRKITELLASQGHFVYAGARKAEDIAALSKINNVQGVKLDVKPLVPVQCNHWVDPRGAARRDETCQCCYGRKNHGYNGDSRDVLGTEAVEQSGEQARRERRHYEADGQATERQA
jgi:hypothetical protein